MATKQLIASNIPFTTSDRTMPQNLEAERAVLGAMVLDNKAIDEVVEILDHTCFYHTAHTIIFEAIRTLYETNRGVDLITLTEELTRQGRLESIGGAYYLTSLLDNVATVSNVKFYAQIIRDKATARQLILAGNEISQLGFSAEVDVHAIVETAEKLILDIAQQREQQGFASLETLLHASMETVERLYREKTLVTGVPSGYKKLDELTSGFQPSDLIIIAGRPSMGKTALALNIARNLSIEQEAPLPVAIFSLEMSKEQLVLRMLATEARISMKNIRGGKLGAKEFGRLSTAGALLAQSEIYIDETPAISRQFY